MKIEDCIFYQRNTIRQANRELLIDFRAPETRELERMLMHIHQESPAR